MSFSSYLMMLTLEMKLLVASILSMIAINDSMKLLVATNLF